MSLEENRHKHPVSLGVTSINVNKGDLLFNSEEKSLIIYGDITFIDGIKKFDCINIHPESSIQLMITALSENEVINLLSQTNTIRKLNNN